MSPTDGAAPVAASKTRAPLTPLAPLDVFVVGGGPVGLATAIAARAHGLSVRLVDRQRPPIDKACGEGLMPAGVAALAALGVALPARSVRFRGIRYVSDGVVAEADFPGGESGAGRGIRRTELHAALVARAEEVGVDLAWGERVEEVRVGEVRTAQASFPCRFVVGADGLHSRVRRAVGLEDPAGVGGVGGPGGRPGGGGGARGRASASRATCASRPGRSAWR